MENPVIHCIANLRKGRYDWTIKVRVIRRWQNTTKEGNLVQGFNVLLLDDQSMTIQAFVAGDSYKKYYDTLLVGNIFIISNFTVKEVTKDKTNLVTQNPNEIFFSGYTKVVEDEDNNDLIPNNIFDFQDLSELEIIQKQKRYLTDVIGVIEDYEPIRRWISPNEAKDSKALINFTLTDGSSFVKVVLWDNFAETFQSLIDEEEEEPFIAIISGARIKTTGDTFEIATSTPTTFYINDGHHVVQEMRQLMLTMPHFTQPNNNVDPNVMYTTKQVEDLNHLTECDTGGKVMLLLRIKQLMNTNDWFFYECTTCREECTIQNALPFCPICEKSVYYADRKFELGCLCEDETGTIALLLTDREVRRLTGKTVFHLTPTNPDYTMDYPIPDDVLNLINTDIRAIIQLKAEHVTEGCNIYTPTYVLLGHSDDDVSGSSYVEQNAMSDFREHYPEASTSTADFHLDSITPFDLTTPDSRKPNVNKKDIKSLPMSDI